jgi:hypothetical protein
LNGLLGDSNGAIHKAPGRGLPVSQEISLSVKGNTVMCSVNGSMVASYDKAVLLEVGKLKSIDGYYGLRFAHNTDVLVTGMAMTGN